MEINYSITGLIILIVIVVVIVLIKRNKRDQKDFEKKINKSEIEPETHKDVDPQ